MPQLEYLRCEAKSTKTKHLSCLRVSLEDRLDNHAARPEGGRYHYLVLIRITVRELPGKLWFKVVPVTASFCATGTTFVGS